MLTVLGVVVFVVALVFSVAWHELGHFIPAKLFKVPVSQFMVGFGPTLWSKKAGETEYGIKWLLLGGYIRMLGMYSPVASPRAAKSGWRWTMADSAREQTREELAAEAAASGDPAAPDGDQVVWATSDEPAGTGGGLETGTAASGDPAIFATRAFYRLSAPRKLVVMLGGPTMNLILALILVAIAISGIGAYTPSTTIESVTPCLAADGKEPGKCGPQDWAGPAAEAGLRAGDKITGWNGQPMANWDDVLAVIRAADGRPATITVERSGESLDLTVEPLLIDLGDGTTRGLVGLTAALEVQRAPVWQAPAVLWSQITASAKIYASLPVRVWDTLVDMVQGNERAIDSPLSMVGAARLSGEVAAGESTSSLPNPWRARWATWLLLAASVNIALWLFNLLPLLPLDGGHVANALFEGGRRQVARWRGRPDPGPADSARLAPLTILVVALLILMTVILVVADVINPVRIS
ncbi:MAG: site-2 protease family protein [Bifidobacteriaceae bacterium]|jgi:membrane-associated protease RseP (regulator of RpoE activity)|nr:site-2 protease family protein [Bifidobacteriaceae bacterium]